MEGSEDEKQKKEGKKRHKTFAPLKVHKVFSSKNIMKPRGQPLAPFHSDFKHFPSQRRREISWIIGMEYLKEQLLPQQR